MLCAEVKVMERASAKIENWYCMIESRVWDRGGGRGF